jgi:polyhydroxybutyrate depolymerase
VAQIRADDGNLPHGCSAPWPGCLDGLNWTISQIAREALFTEVAAAIASMLTGRGCESGQRVSLRSRPRLTFVGASHTRRQLPSLDFPVELPRRLVPFCAAKATALRFHETCEARLSTVQGMMATRTLSTAAFVGLLVLQWGCSPAESSEEGSPTPEPGAPVVPSEDGQPPSDPAVTPDVPAGDATDGPSSEAPPTPSFQQPDGSTSGGGELPSTSAGTPPVGTPPVSTPPAATCAGASSLPAGNQSFTIEHDGRERTFIVHVPGDLDPSRRAPLVVDMHGLTSSAGAQAALSGWRAKADEEGFIVVHPQGLGNSWNGGDLCCGSSQSGDVDDEGFIRAMVAQIEEQGCIDSQRVYATGLSNGGAMSHLLACNAADLFAATAPVSMGNGARPCEPSRPISVVMTRGTRDALVNFDGGLFPSAQEDFEQWAALNGCEGEPEAQGELCQAYTSCDAGVEVKLCALDAGHVLYDNAQDFSVPDTVWATFERQVLQP